MWYVIGGITLLLIAFLIIWIIYIDYVDNNSDAMLNLKKINDKYSFKEVNRYFEHKYDNENFYDSISCIDYLTYQLQFIRYDVYKEIDVIKENRNKYERYKEEIKNDCVLGNFNNYKKFFIKSIIERIEKNRCHRLVKHPEVEYTIRVSLARTDLNGHVFERKSEAFSEKIIRDIIKRLNDKNGTFYNDREIWESLTRVERGRLSNKLRFAIYQRDGNRCKCCGRRGTRTDLEIDHIVPIAKGGKTEWNNLQTLCPRCNKEKGTRTIRY